MRQTAIAISLILLTAGCEGAALNLSADHQVVAAGGCDKATIVATVTIGGKPASGKKVDFETTAGSFSPTEELTYASSTTDESGRATVELYTTKSVGQATVTASFTDDNYQAEGSITIRFGPPTGRFAPVSDKVSLQCDALNIGAYRHDRPEIVVPCTLSAETASGCPLPASAFLAERNMVLRAEAGTLEVLADEWSGSVVLRYRSTGGEPHPVDVDPVSGEPSRPGPLGETLNPRDGAVTLLVALKGREGFQDLNGNGVHDEGEPFDDIPEPFLDVDDDGIYTAGIDPYFVDSDGDGSYSPPNGTYDATTYIAATFKIVWSGDLAEHEDAARLVLDGPADIPNGGSAKVRVLLLDERLNPIAAFAENSDSLYYSLTGSVLLSPSTYTQPLSNVSALRFDDQGLYLQYIPDVAVFEATLSDDDSSYTADPPLDWTLEVSVNASPGWAADGSLLPQATYSFETILSGTSR